MIIWLINPYGPIPGEGWRDYSFTMMGEVLSSKGHEVIWWTSNFSHHFKKFRSGDWEDRKINDKFTIRLVPTPSYKNNIGFGRIFRDMVFAYRAYFQGKKETKPDCILYAESPLTFGYASPALAAHHNSALIYDQMDLWPELIVKAFPKWLQPVANFLFYPVYSRRKSVFRRLDGVMALAKPYLEVIFDEVPSLRSIPNDVIYNGIDVKSFRIPIRCDDSDLPVKGTDELWAIFAGSLGPSYDILNLIAVAKKLEINNSHAVILIAGDGPFRPAVEQAAKECNNIRYLGKLTPEFLTKVYRMCDVGLSAYKKTSNVEMPDKFYDYTAAGLAIINSLTGEVAQQIFKGNLGLQYIAGDEFDLYSKLNLLASKCEILAEMKRNSLSAGSEFDQRTQYGRLPLLIEKSVHYKACRNELL